MADMDLLSILAEMVGTVLFTLAYYAFLGMVLVSLSFGVADRAVWLVRKVKEVARERHHRNERRAGRVGRSVVVSR